MIRVRRSASIWRMSISQRFSPTAEAEGDQLLNRGDIKTLQMRLVSESRLACTPKTEPI
jgi:hypothetical protein